MKGLFDFQIEKQYGRPAVRKTDPETSKEAWEGVKHKSPALRDRIVEFLLRRGFDGATITEISQELGYQGARDSISPRMSELERAGRASKSGKKRVPGRGLAAQTVWIVR